MASQLNPLKVGVMLFFVLVVGCLFGAVQTYPSQTPISPNASPFVMVSAGGGHGSGTHIGNGMILTAFHVTDKNLKFKIKTEDGRELDGVRLFQSDVADVGIVYVKAFADIDVAKLSCAPNFVGQAISMVGNPEGVEFAKTWGRVSGVGKTGMEDALEGQRWKELVTLDATAAHGVSGAGVVNDAGEVVGILVSGIETPNAAYPYTFMVPGSAICHAMARS